ncbi:hypothetical protein BCON_0062g00010 [Botryotinia convoluta]|uniref:Uncharacterized protein n=1 Tax=Botryotinia convoluta TaxID=54673 RepID=A0A4Z1IAX3_9HELO|nr:hypothetical protein BCON_0062g00010 [Botryotinia convoluta]
MHRSKKIYGDDANVFHPERWEGSELKGVDGVLCRFMADRGFVLVVSDDFVCGVSWVVTNNVK